jgi:hypothetical protein
LNDQFQWVRLASQSRALEAARKGGGRVAASASVKRASVADADADACAVAAGT